MRVFRVLVSSGVIRESELREVIRVQPALVVRAVGRRDAPGFEIQALVAGDERTLIGSRGAPRAFATLNAVANCVESLGATQFVVDLTNRKVGLVRKPREDRAAALRQIQASVTKTKGKTSKP